MTELETFQTASTTFKDTATKLAVQVALRAPSAFVPTGEKVLDAPADPRHDRPLENAVGGRIRYRLTNETPLLVGGTGQSADSNNSPAQAPDGRWVLPGTSVRGMIRAVLECVAFARLSFVDDCAAATRDFNDPTWKEEVAPSQTMALGGGWLFITSGGWRLVEASEVYRVHFDTVLAWAGGIDEPIWHEMRMHARLDALASAGRGGLVDGANFGHPGRQARCVVAGITAPEDRVDRTDHAGNIVKQRKHNEHLFIWPEEDELEARTFQIDARTGERFVMAQARDSRAHQGDPRANFSALTASGRATGFAENWHEWQRARKDRLSSFSDQIRHPDKFAIPVFWRNPKDRQNQRQARPQPNTILSLTPFLRYTYQNGLREIIERHPRAAGDDTYDLAQAIFGWAPQDGASRNLAGRPRQERSLRSRVRFGFATSDQGEEQLETETRSWAATRPRASFWPYYLKPHGSALHPGNGGEKVGHGSGGVVPLRAA